MTTKVDDTPPAPLLFQTRRTKAGLPPLLLTADGPIEVTGDLVKEWRSRLRLS